MSKFNRFDYISLILAESHRKPLGRLISEFAHCTIQIRRLPAHYITSFIYRENSGDWNNYLDRRTMDKIWSSPRLHHPLGTRILQNKLFFDCYFKETGIDLPRTIGYCSNGYAFINNARLPLTDLPAIMEQLLTQSRVGSVFIKPIEGINGAMCQRFDWDDFNLVDMHNLRREIARGNFIFQETLQQHPLLSAVYPRSINTLRMDTFVRDDGSVAIISALMRFGMHGREIDNGGCFISVDLDRGMVAEHALCFIHLGGGIYDKHPNTNYTFSGLKVPFFAEAKSLVSKAAALIPSRLVGWDIAITPLGPVLVEGNHNYHLGMADTAAKGYKSNPRFQEVLRLI